MTTFLSTIQFFFIFHFFSLNATPKALPNMALQKGVFESDNLKLHLCNSVYEAYSGSYLTTKTHMLTAASEVYNLTWVNCEMASFVHMKESRKMFSTPQGDGMIMQSLDVLDFSVIHLSAFERSSNRYRYRLYDNKDDQNKKWTDITAVKEAARKLELQNNPKYAKMNVTWSDESKRTVAIMPFLGM